MRTRNAIAGRMRAIVVALTCVAVTAGVLGPVEGWAAEAPTAAGSAATSTQRSRLVSGWFGYWTDPSEMISIAKSSNGVLGEVNIFWWANGGAANPVCTLSSSGVCQSGWTTTRFAQAAKGLRALGILVYATHTDLSYAMRGTLSSYLRKKSRRAAIAARFADYAVRAGVDGVDLDWENFAFNDGTSTWTATRSRFVKTIVLMSQKLHAVGKRLSVTVPGGYAPGSSSGGYWVYDWKAIAPYVDRLRLMTYDYSWNRPGPIGPHDWTEKVLKSAVSQVGRANRRKLYVGAHQYGKAWYDRDSKDGYVTSGACAAGWRPSGSDAIVLSPSQAAGVARSYGVKPVFNRTAREWTFRYLKRESGTYRAKSGRRHSQVCNVWKESWYGDSRTAVGRAELVRKYRVGGLAVWQLGSTNSDFYPSLAPFTR